MGFLIGLIYDTVFVAPEIVSWAPAETVSVDADRLRPFGLLDYGTMATLTLGGLPSRHTVVYLEGVPLNSPITGSVDLTALPQGALDGFLSMEGFPQITLKLKKGLWARWGFTSEAGGSNGFLWASLYRRRDSYGYTDPWGREGEVRNAWRFGSAGGFRVPLGKLRVFGYLQAYKGGSPGPTWSPTPTALLADTMGFVGFRGLGLSGFLQGQRTLYRTPADTARSASLRAGLDGEFFAITHERALGGTRTSWRVFWQRENWELGVEDFWPVGWVSLGLWPGVKLRLEADLHQPTFGDLYWPPDQFAEGNPSLKPEKVLMLQLWRERPRVWASLRVLFDYIAWVPGQRWHPENLSPVFAPEIGFRSRWGGVIWSPVRWRGERLPYLSDWRAWIRAEFKGIFVKGAYTGPRAVGVGGSLLEGFWLWDTGWKLERSRFSLGFEIKNLLNQNPEVIPGYPLPGRRLEVSLCVRPWR